MCAAIRSTCCRILSRMFRLSSTLAFVMLVLFLSLSLIDFEEKEMYDAQVNSQLTSNLSANITLRSSSNGLQTSFEDEKKIQEEEKSAQQLRKETMRSVCESNWIPSFRSTTVDYYRDSNHSVGYCQIAKVGTSSLLRLLVEWKGKIAAKRHSFLYIHRMAHNKLQRVPDTVLEEDRKQGVQVTKIMFVRHPFARLVSAYRDKVLEGMILRYTLGDLVLPYDRKIDHVKDEMFSKFSKKMKKNYLSFREFAWIVTHSILFCLDAKGDRSFCLKAINQHWRPQFHSCSPCAINYDIIGKMETFDEDLQLLLTRTALPPASTTHEHATLNLIHKYDGFKPNEDAESNKASDIKEEKNIDDKEASENSKKTEELLDEDKNEQENGETDEKSKLGYHLSTEEASKLYYERMTEAELENIRRAYQFDYELYGYDPLTYSESSSK